MQSALFVQLEGQLGDQGGFPSEAIRLGEQHEREAQVDRKEVERLDERVASRRIVE